jgi:type IV secretory pathway TrbL component
MASSAVHPSTTAAELATHAMAYHRFMLGVKWVLVVLASFLTWSTLTFATAAGFWVGTLSGIIVFFIGVWAMRNFLAHSTESDNPA